MPISTSIIPIRNVNQPNPMAKKLSDANTTSPMDMSSRSRPVPSVGPKNLDGRREFVWLDIRACRSSRTLMIGNHAVTPSLSLELHEKEECISVPAGARVRKV